MKFYRYETITFASLDDDETFSRTTIPNIQLRLMEFELFKETDKGYWIAYGAPEGLMSPHRWVSKTSKKKYAYLTIEEALDNFKRRTRKHIAILTAKIQNISRGLWLAEEIDKVKIKCMTTEAYLSDGKGVATALQFTVNDWKFVIENELEYVIINEGSRTKEERLFKPDIINRISELYKMYKALPISKQTCMWNDETIENILNGK
jgi:hypothetical protein